MFDLHRGKTTKILTLRTHRKTHKIKNLIQGPTKKQNKHLFISVSKGSHISTKNVNWSSSGTMKISCWHRVAYIIRTLLSICHKHFYKLQQTIADIRNAHKSKPSATLFQALESKKNFVCVTSAWNIDEQDSHTVADLSLNSVFYAGMFTNIWGWQWPCSASPVISFSTACSQSCSANGCQVKPMPPAHP